MVAKCETAVVVGDGNAHKLTAKDGGIKVEELHQLYSNQEETDTRVVLYLHHAADQLLGKEELHVSWHLIVRQTAIARF